jgi:hypothetical protein
MTVLVKVVLSPVDFPARLRPRCVTSYVPFPVYRDTAVTGSNSSPLSLPFLATPRILFPATCHFLLLSLPSYQSFQ